MKCNNCHEEEGNYSEENCKIWLCELCFWMKRMDKHRVKQILKERIEG